MRAKPHNVRNSARRYAIKLVVDIKDDLLFGEELYQYIKASVQHDTGKSYHCDKFYDMCEEYVIKLYEKYVIQCSCCKKYIHRDNTRSIKKSRYCLKCHSDIREEQRK